ncbi:sulfhydryl oxidase 2 [Anolis sagrei]|uniref:sulfhydryl oxidase 2 n=1 Tax=Anolis sagrei TaxID=38937 RepID=UPI00351F95E7
MEPGGRCWWLVAGLWGLWAAGAGGAGLYQSGVDPVWVLEGSVVREALREAAWAWLVQFYSSSCGHCVAFAPAWKALAADVHDWERAIRIGVLDCGDEANYETCKEYGIQYYPTFRYFRAFTKEFTTGESQLGSDRELPTVRQSMIDFLQNHSQEAKPPACPPLEPIVPEEMFTLFDKKIQHYTAIIFESENSYVGREVILDLIPYDNVVVKRALDSDPVFLEKLGIVSLPSLYLICPNGTHGLRNVLKPLRSFFSSYLKSLPGVRQKSPPQLPTPAGRNGEGDAGVKEWKDFDPSKLYMADLESGLHYMLRVELATHKTLEGTELQTFKSLIALLAKLFPGPQPTVKLLETLHVWLVSLPLERIPYNAVLDLLDNKMRMAGLFLPSRVQWVGCQGSQAELRGYPCSFWTLFHVLTVQAAARPNALLNTGLEGNPRGVLEVMRKYVRDFFGCRACAKHFEEMAGSSLDTVRTPEEAALWLWEKHNEVNARLAGDLTEDPKFPKAQWPSPEACPSCRKGGGGVSRKDRLPSWDEAQVLRFLRRHYGSGNVEYRYAESRPEVEKGPLEEAQEDERKPKGSFLGFSSLDMSLCIALYGTSSFFLMLMFFFFRMRSKRRKARPSRPHV